MLLDPSGELSNRGEGYIGVVVGQRHRIGLAADKAVASGPIFRPGSMDPARGGQVTVRARSGAGRCGARKGSMVLRQLLAAMARSL